MLKIRQAQLDALALAMVRATARQRAREWADAFPDLAAGRDEAELTAIADEALVRAWGYGLRASTDLRAFVQLAFSVAPRFDLHPPFRKLLENSRIDPAARLERLFAQATPEDWQAAAMQH